MFSSIVGLSSDTEEDTRIMREVPLALRKDVRRVEITKTRIGVSSGDCPKRSAVINRALCALKQKENHASSSS